jgi:hypothetical protein
LMEARGMYHEMVMRQMAHDARESDPGWALADVGSKDPAPGIRLNEV